MVTRKPVSSGNLNLKGSKAYIVSGANMGLKNIYAKKNNKNGL